jgi:hypothetical protein
VLIWRGGKAQHGSDIRLGRELGHLTAENDAWILIKNVIWTADNDRTACDRQQGLADMQPTKK